MTTSAIAERQPTIDAEAIERVLIGGDLSKLTDEQRLSFYKQVCQSLGLNPLTKPFEYIWLDGKLTLYARKDCTEQLRNLRNISLTIPAREVTEGCYVVTAKASMPTGRADESIGVVPIEGLKGLGRANAMMKTETKAKRRVTLSICGLGILDESELDTIPPEALAPPPLAVQSTQSTQAETPESTDIPPDARLILKVDDGPAGSKGRLHFSAPVEGQDSLVTWQQWVVDLATELVETREPVLVKTKRSAAGNVRVDGLKRLNPVGPPPDLGDVPF